MRNIKNNILRGIFCENSFFFRIRNMWWKSSLTNSFTRLNSLNRSRKIILGLFLTLMFLYYLIPKLFSSASKYRSAVTPGVTATSPCMAQKVHVFQDDIVSFDAVLDYVPPTQEGNYPPYVGNGYLAASFDSQNGLYVRLNRALSLPVRYYPVVGTSIEGVAREEVNVLQLRAGVANRIQVFNTKSGCVSIESQLYAHRSRPSTLVQELYMSNPTRSDVSIDLDQIGESGWPDEGLQKSTGEISKYKYSLTSGVVKIEGETELYVALSVATSLVKDKQELLGASKVSKQYIITTVHYTKAGELSKVKAEFSKLESKCKEDLEAALEQDKTVLKGEHTKLWGKIWESGFSISYSKAAGALNGEKINSTIYYVLSNVPAPLHDPTTSKELALQLRRTLHYPDKCYNGHTLLHSTTLWIDPIDEDSIARIVTTWIITLEKQGCQSMIAAGVEGVLQAMILSIGSLHFGHDHLEMRLQPQDTHRDFRFHRINYGNNTHLNISVIVGDDNKANIFVALDRNDRPYYACDAGCLDAPVQLSKTESKFPVKLTNPYTAILYITADKPHMEEYKHAIHVQEIVEAPAHEHHVIALHKHGHHFGGLPTIFWVSIAFLVTVFHLFLCKLVYNEYCQAQERYTKSRYHV